MRRLKRKLAEVRDEVLGEYRDVPAEPVVFVGASPAAAPQPPHFAPGGAAAAGAPPASLPACGYAAMPAPGAPACGYAAMPAPVPAIAAPSGGSPAAVPARGGAPLQALGRGVVQCAQGAFLAGDIADNTATVGTAIYDIVASYSGAVSALPAETAAIAVPMPFISAGQSLHLAFHPRTPPLARAQHGATAVRDGLGATRWALAAAGVAEPAAGVAAGAAGLTMVLQGVNFARSTYTLYGAVREDSALGSLKRDVMAGRSQAIDTMIAAAYHAPNIEIQGRTLWESQMLNERFMRIKFIIDQLRREKKWKMASASGGMVQAIVGFCLAGASCGLAVASLAGAACPPASLALLATGAAVGLGAVAITAAKEMARVYHYHYRCEEFRDRAMQQIDFYSRRGQPHIAKHLSDSLRRMERLTGVLVGQKMFGCLQKRVGMLRYSSEVLARIMYAELLAESWFFMRGPRPDPQSPEGLFHALLVALGFKFGVFQVGLTRAPDGRVYPPYDGADPHGANLVGGYEIIRRRFAGAHFAGGPFTENYERLVETLAKQVMRGR